MSGLRDRFGKEVQLGDRVVYGANRGLIIGVVVKWNPNTFKIRSLDSLQEGTVNIPYGFSVSLALIDSITSLDEALLTEEESNRIQMDRSIRKPTS
jgi:hypothetical protein